MRINNNTLSNNVNKNLKINTTKQSKNMQKISSGLRINSASDDVAGLGISEKMRAQIRGLEQASKNAQDGISLIQTAEGALGEVHSTVQRIRELTVQAGNDTNTLEDRQMIQDEINQLVSSIDDIAENTEFNNMKLLNGSLGRSKSMPLKELLESDSDDLNIIYVEDTHDFSTTTSGVGNETVTGYTSMKDQLQTELVPQAVTSILSKYSPAFDYLKDSSIGIGLNIYTDKSSSTLASVGIGYSYTSDKTLITNMVTYKLSVNTSTLVFDASGNLTEDSRTSLESTIAHEMMHALMDEALTNGMIGVTDGKLDSSNAFPDWFVEGMAQTASGAYDNSNDWINGSFKITDSTSEADISAIVKKNGLTSGSTSSKYGTGYLATMYIGYLAGGSSMDANSIAKGLGEVLNKLKDGSSLDSVIKDVTGSKYSGLSDFEKKFGDSDSSAFIKKLTAAVGDKGNGGLVSGNLKDSDMLANNKISTNLFKLDTTNDTVKNIYPDNHNIFSGGGSINAGKDSTGSFTPHTGSSGAISGGVTLTDGITLQIGANQGQTMKISIGAADSMSLGISSISVMSSKNAEKAIEACDKAIERVSSNRSRMGSYQNRLEYAISNLDNSKENTQASESRIRDMDMAKGMLDYSNTSILMQAAQTLLAQANNQPQQILSLLQ